MVASLSVGLIIVSNAFAKVVFPLPIGPRTIMKPLYSTRSQKYAARRGVKVPSFKRWAMLSGDSGNFLNHILHAYA